TIGLSIIILSLLLFSRQQLPSTIGLSKQNIFKSLFFGFIMLIGFFFILLFYDYIFNGKIEIIILYPFLTYFVYDFIQFGIIEELIFRGYIGTRIRSIIKNRWVSMIVVAILFSSIHLIPYISPLEMSIW